VNAVDHDMIPKVDENGMPVLDSQGLPVMEANPYNVVVSVMMLKEGWDVRNVKVIVPLRPCDSRTLTEQTLGRGLRKMHAPIIDEEGATFLKTEDLFVIEHPSFRSIIDRIKDIIEEKSSDEIEHTREYVPILQKPDVSEREALGVRLVRFEGMREVVPDWRKSFDMERVPALSPRLVWKEEFADTEIHTYLKEALGITEKDGQTFTIPDVVSYRDFDHVIEVAMVVPLLRDLRTSYHHKNAVKGIVREFLERKTFNFPPSVPIYFDRIPEGEHARVALGNLARTDVIAAVKKALQPHLGEAILAERRTSEPQFAERKTHELSGYQALKKNVIEAPKKCSFDRAAVENADEEAVAHLLDEAKDVTAWVYNHRSGIGYNIQYEWQGLLAHYYPDFIARARLGEVFHNFIIEVKGRMDDRDKAKARRGRRYCELLTEYDSEPWHYLFLIENPSDGRTDITWWEQRSSPEISHLLRHHEGLPLVPNSASQPPSATTIEVVPSVTAEERFHTAVPVYDLAVAAGAFSEGQAPEPTGWAKVRATRQLDSKMFLARVVGHSMEAAVPDGSWGLFRMFAAGTAPSATALDGKRVIVQLRDETDPDTGGKYTLKRWKVSKFDEATGVEQVELRPDNPAYKTMKYTAGDGDLRVVAEFLEVVG